MSESDKIDHILKDLESGALTPEDYLTDTNNEQPALFRYLFLDENEMLTSREKDQLIFLHGILWNLRSRDRIVKQEDIEILEEEFWAEKEAGLFPYDTAHAAIEKLSDDTFSIIMDCTETDDFELTRAGSEWLMIKGFVIAALICT